MSMHASLHRNFDSPAMEAVGEMYNTDITDAGFAMLKIRVGREQVDIFTTELKDLETIAFHLEALIRTARDEHGWGEPTPTDVPDHGGYVELDSEPIYHMP